MVFFHMIIILSLFAFLKTNEANNSQDRFKDRFFIHKERLPLIEDPERVFFLNIP